MAIPFSALISRSRIRMALIGIPLCFSGIALIFWLKPQSGSTIRGLSLLTASIQALGAIAVVLFFTGLREYLSYKESLRKIVRKVIDKKSLLEKSRRIGQTCCVDTSPNPEHIDEWVENARDYLRGSLLDLLDEHPVAPADFSEVLAAVEEGFHSLLESKNRNREMSDLSLHTAEILDLVPRVIRGIGEEPGVRKHLEPENRHAGSGQVLPKGQ